MINIHIAGNFFDFLSNLNAKETKQFSKAMRQLKSDPSSPALRRHKLDRTPSKNLVSYSVNRDIRIIALEPTRDDIYLLYINHHDVAYQWAENRKIEQGEGAQIFSVIASPTEAAPQSPAPEPLHQDAEPKTYDSAALSELLPERQKGKAGLFDPYTDFEIMALGVPRGYIPMVRRILSENDLEFLLDKIPPTVADILIEATASRSDEPTSEGHPKLEVITPAPEEKVDYRSIRGDEELDQILADLDAAMSRSFKDWRVYLHPVQRKAVEAKSKGPTRITGGAGTGKTVCGLHRANFLLDQGYKKVVLLTYNNDLTRNLQELAVDLMGPKVGEQVMVSSFFQYLDGLLARRGRQLSRRAMTPAEFFRPAIESVPTSNLAREWNDSLINALYQEICEVIAPQNLKTVDEYIRAKRPKGFVPLKLAQKKTVWEVYQASWQHACKTGEMHYDLTSHLAMTLGVDPDPAVALVVDEVQDLRATDLAFLGAVAPGPCQLTLLEDSKQRIYGRGYSLKKLGINIQGRRSINLHINYRTTEQIGDVAAKSLESLDLPLSDIPRAVRSGPAPVVFQSSDTSEELNWVAQKIDELKAEGFAKIAVIARKKEILKQMEPVFLQRRIAFQKGRTGTNLGSDSGVVLTTMHSAKGLEFEIVFIVGYRQPRLPTWAKSMDSVRQEDELRKEKHLLYVATSRARDRLYVSGPEEFPYV